MAEQTKGADILDALMEQVEQRVDGVRRTPNRSKTYTRLEVGGQTFAYVFPPGRQTVSVKIPRQLAATVARKLPKGHGFRRTAYGLTRSVGGRSEARTAARALAVAAREVAG